MRIIRGSNYTTFSATAGTGSASIMMRRIFHPTRGEEVQMELEIIKADISRRKYTQRANVTMTPDEAKQFVTVLVGRLAPDIDPKPSMSGGLNTRLNAYQPIRYVGSLTEREQRIAKDAYLDGWDARDGLK